FTCESRHPSARLTRPALCAKSRHSALQKERRYSITSSARLTAIAGGRSGHSFALSLKFEIPRTNPRGVFSRVSGLRRDKRHSGHFDRAAPVVMSKNPRFHAGQGCRRDQIIAIRAECRFQLVQAVGRVTGGAECGTWCVTARVGPSCAPKPTCAPALPARADARPEHPLEGRRRRAK